MRTLFLSGIVTLTVFVSAFLLFMVQPLFAKMILPVLGGSAAVWTSAMLFFQMVLLCGYLYSHLTTKYLTLLPQIILHVVILISGAYVLSFAIDYESVTHESPVSWLLMSAWKTIGWPFFILSTSAPLLQRWFSYTSHPRRENPYFLYAASNMGSMLALLGFPFLIERSLNLGEQKAIWGNIYIILCMLFTLSGILVYAQRDTSRAKPLHDDSESSVSSYKIDWNARFRWILFAFLPSSLMLGLTSYVTTDIAAVSLFWVVPLALYLGSFILVFSREKDFSNNFYVYSILLSVLGVLTLLIFGESWKALSVVFNLVLFFLLSIFFHGRLSSAKPEPSKLTEFYIWISLGGVLGGVFNAALSPVIFNFSMEYLLILFYSLTLFSLLMQFPKMKAETFVKKAGIRFLIQFCILLFFDKLLSQEIGQTQIYGIWFLLSVLFLTFIVLYRLGKIKRWELICNLTLVVFFAVFLPYFKHNIIASERTFYASLRVSKQDDGDRVVHAMAHGTTIHGSQIFSPATEQKEILSYFHPAGAFGDIAKAFIHDKSDTVSVGIVGLGVGAISCYAREHDTVTFFEIDKAVEDLARDPRFFTFLELCPAEVLIGDGRIMLQKVQDTTYDLLIIDAFSSDSIPTHLLTQEAVQLYLSKLKKNAALAFQITNRHMKLEQVFANHTLPDGYRAYFSERGLKNIPYYAPHKVVLIVHDSALPEMISNSSDWVLLEKDSSKRPWTDDFTDIVSTLIFPWD